MSMIKIILFCIGACWGGDESYTFPCTINKQQYQCSIDPKDRSTIIGLLGEDWPNNLGALLDLGQKPLDHLIEVAISADQTAAEVKVLKGFAPHGSEPGAVIGGNGVTIVNDKDKKEHKPGVSIGSLFVYKIVTLPLEFSEREEMQKKLLKFSLLNREKIMIALFKLKRPEITDAELDDKIDQGIMIISELFFIYITRSQSGTSRARHSVRANCVKLLINMHHPFLRTECRSLSLSIDNDVGVTEPKTEDTKKLRDELGQKKIDLGEYEIEMSKLSAQVEKARIAEVQHGIKEIWKLVKGGGDDELQLTKEIDPKLYAYHMLMLLTVIFVISNNSSNYVEAKGMLIIRTLNMHIIHALLDKLKGCYPWELEDVENIHALLGTLKGRYPWEGML